MTKEELIEKLTVDREELRQMGVTSLALFGSAVRNEIFPIVKRNDEQKFGEYRTKRVILECYDAMAEAMKTGRSYQTILDPSPADPRIAHQVTGSEV